MYTDCTKLLLRSRGTPCAPLILGQGAQKPYGEKANSYWIGNKKEGGNNIFDTTNT